MPDMKQGGGDAPPDPIARVASMPFYVSPIVERLCGALAPENFREGDEDPASAPEGPDSNARVSFDRHSMTGSDPSAKVANRLGGIERRTESSRESPATAVARPVDGPGFRENSPISDIVGGRDDSDSQAEAFEPTLASMPFYISPVVERLFGALAPETFDDADEGNSSASAQAAPNSSARVRSDLHARLRRGERPCVLFDARVLLDALLLRDSALPAARALTLASLQAVEGFVCASAFDVVSARGADSGVGRKGREREIARDLMGFLRILPLTEKTLHSALEFDRLSLEDAQVAAAGAHAGIDFVLTSDRRFLGNHESACTPKDLVSAFEETPDGRYRVRILRDRPAFGSRIEISAQYGEWRQTLP